MIALRLKSLPLAFLVGCSIFLTRSLLSASIPAPGSPLTAKEYRVFFASWKPEWKMRVVCKIRRTKGCEDPKIVQLDQYENHGLIPDGPICADLPHTPSFESFCLFAQFRCSNQQLYIKRIPCPSLAKESGASTETPHSIVLEISKKHPQAGSMKKEAPSQEILIQASSPPTETDIHANIDSFLKYAFAVSGQEPVPKGQASTPPQASWKIISAPVLQPRPDFSQGWHIIAPTEPSISDFRTIETSEGQTGPSFQQNYSPLTGTIFVSEKPLNAENTQAPYLNLPEVQETKVKGSLLDLEKDDAVVILCYALLQSSCLFSAVTKAWKQVETKTLGYGDLVCDNFGRRHADLCTMCAFCSLKTEQCQGATDLNRIPCDGGTFTTYINPGVLAQHQATSPTKERQQVHEDSQLQYQCGVLATYGCEDSRVALWLQKEYSEFEGGDFPEKVCDSTRILHPNYCAFKSHECLQYYQYGNKVWRHGCQKNVVYHVLSEDEGDKEVRLWSKRFLSFAEG
ncbi:hypothetical protein lerEdw1_020605 [Lerista edwardsae]|nr:hypothetical protein lerEdw1_020605 [Lerista edwardsae]